MLSVIHKMNISGMYNIWPAHSAGYLHYQPKFTKSQKDLQKLISFKERYAFQNAIFLGINIDDSHLLNLININVEDFGHNNQVTEIIVLTKQTHDADIVSNIIQLPTNLA